MTATKRRVATMRRFTTSHGHQQRYTTLCGVATALRWTVYTAQSPFRQLLPALCWPMTSPRAIPATEASAPRLTAPLDRSLPTSPARSEVERSPNLPTTKTTLARIPTTTARECPSSSSSPARVFRTRAS